MLAPGLFQRGLFIGGGYAEGHLQVTMATVGQCGGLNIFRSIGINAIPEREIRKSGRPNLRAG